MVFSAASTYKFFRYLYAFKQKFPDTVYATYVLTGTLQETVSRCVTTSNPFSNNYQPVKILDSFSSLDGSSSKRQLKTVKLVSESELEGENAKVTSHEFLTHVSRE